MLEPLEGRQKQSAPQWRTRESFSTIHLMTDFYSILPHLNATLNASSFVLLSSGYYFIRRGRVLAHRRCQLAALTASIVFLISYIVYHAHHGTTRFAGQGIARPIYFTILTTHTILAAVIVPFGIVTARR